jgi:hypothetical protein
MSWSRFSSPDIHGLTGGFDELIHLKVTRSAWKIDPEGSLHIEKGRRHCRAAARRAQNWLVLKSPIRQPRCLNSDIVGAGSEVQTAVPAKEQKDCCSAATIYARNVR